jgi:hypothetical protein
MRTTPTEFTEHAVEEPDVQVIDPPVEPPEVESETLFPYVALDEPDTIKDA